MTIPAVPGPFTPEIVKAARDVVLVTVAGGAPAASEAVGCLPAGQLLDVAALLALYAAQPRTVVLTTEEWELARAAMGGQP